MMSNKALTFAAIALGGVLFLLVILSALSSSLFNSKKNPALQVSPPQIEESNNSFDESNRIEPTLSLEDEEKKLNEAADIKILSSDEAEKLAKFTESLPYTSPNLDIVYSPTLNQFFVRKKTAKGESEFQKILSENGLTGIYRSFGFFKSVDKDVNVARAEAEQSFLDEKAKELERRKKSSQNKRTRNLSKEHVEKDTKSLVEALRAMIDFPTREGSSGANLSPTAIGEIFKEAGEKVGVPPRLLEAFNARECSLLDLPANLVAEYSRPGGRLPPGNKCVSYAGAKGPFQFIDSTWARYASAVNRFGGYTHTPNVFNIRDSAYAAAEYLKSMAHAASPTQWTKDEVYRAAGGYCGSQCRPDRACGADYCGGVWGYYSGGQ